MDQNTVKTAVQALVGSRIDYCNSILYGVSGKFLQKLQRVQNAAARVVCQASKREHVTPLLRSLHWLPIQKRIVYKILLLTYKSIHGLAPAYVNSMLAAHTPVRQLRSSTRGLLSIPKTKLKSYGDHAFSSSAPRLWNSLPQVIRASPSLLHFKQQLKTHLFREYYY